MIGAIGLPGGVEWIIILLFCGFPLIAAGVAGFVVYRFLRKRAADRETRCRRCGYILRGISEPRCPECGERI